MRLPESSIVLYEAVEYTTLEYLVALMNRGENVIMYLVIYSNKMNYDANKREQTGTLQEFQ